MKLDLDSHVAVVTGGASGIGRAVAEGFAAEGAKVAVWDRSDTVAALADDIAQRYGTAVIGCGVDVTDGGAVNDALRRTESELGPVDHLAHAAAAGSGKHGFPFLNLTPADWPRALDINIMGMVNVAYAVAPGMVERKRGTMVFLASVAGQIGSPTDPPYSASKAANINFAQCMAKDLAPSRVRVNSVCPGMVQTPLNKSMWQAWHDRQPPEKRIPYEEWSNEKVRKVVPLGRWQQPEDVANMVIFLSSERAAQITGQTINVDGGYVMHW